MAFTPVELTKGGQTRIAETADAETQLRFDGWVPTGTPTVVPIFDDRVRDLIEDEDSVTAGALREAFETWAEDAELSGGLTAEQIAADATVRAGAVEAVQEAIESGDIDVSSRDILVLDSGDPMPGETAPGTLVFYRSA